MKKDKYEISLWEDYLVPATIIDGKEDVPAHYEERKIAVIGSDSMTSPCRAYNPKLIENINGTNSFTFEMFYTYRENNGAEGNADQQNPFLNLLVNERKVKCKWKDKWYDFIIKKCQEDSSGKKITYTCQDLYINELSKNGFSLTFDNELENNTGTAPELVKKVLKGTDWMLSENNDIIQQEKEEPVYEVKLLQNLIANKDSSPKETGVTIPKDATILIFYNQLQEIITKVNENEGNYPSSINLQFAYSPVYQTEKNSQLVINADVYSINNLKIEKSIDGDTTYLKFSYDEQVVFNLYFNGGVSKEYRAKKLVKSKISKFDPTTERYCNVLLANVNGEGYSTGDTIYEYSTTEWNDALVAQNLIVNGSNFIKTDGWTPCGNSAAIPKLGLYYKKEGETTFGISCLGLSANTTYLNDSIKHTTSFLPEEGLIKGDTYVLRFKIRETTSDTDEPSPYYITDYSGISVAIKNYTILDNEISIGENFYLKKQNEWIKPKQDEDWVEAEFICTKSLTKKEIHVNQVGLFFTNGDNYTRWIEEIQLFRKIIGSKDGQEIRINPGDFDISSVSKIVYKYYNYTINSGKINKDDIEYLHVSTSPWTDDGKLEVQYTDNFDKVRSISAKQSNRFNILQTIAETFECWLQFKILHDENTGKIIYQKGIPQKFVSIKSEIGQETGIGFIYGIDLKTISRTIQSDQIVTKTIVSANDNEFAPSGSCDISRSIENYPRVNYILNFDYYISQGLLDGGQLNNDLYDSTGDICYYYNLNKINKQYQENSELLVVKNQELLKQQAMQTTYNEAYTASLANVNQLKEELRALAGTTSYDDNNTKAYIEENKDIKEVYAKVNALAVEEQKVKNYNELVNQLTASINRLSTQIEDKTDEQKALIEEAELLDEKFYKKYFRFIQEGSWTSQDYIDDNLYFLDAQSVAYTSSRPQISYDISVIRISNQEGFENKIFKLGDIAYIQDTEFFGYTYINQVKTPYKEKVLVSSITSYFDEPSKDTFTVQNYKTQFEDLFQRITSTTQSLQYASGKYAKAANIMNDDGTINIETLQSSIAVNENIVYSAQNETFKQDDTGITLTDANNPNDKTKINSKGIFISTDGGTTWKNAVRGEGISTQYLTAGNINVGSIVILDGQFTTFRWDSKGISAYVPIDGGGINLGKFVRFDHYGIYGVNGVSNFSPTSEQDIYDKANFGMTWNRFFMKNNKGTGSIEISTDKDIQIKAGEKERIKIGRLDESGQQYGIRISNDSGESVMETGDEGKLWLKKQLNISKSNNTYNIQLGFLDKTKENNIHEVFNATDKFIVYEDGSMKATDGEFTGTIHATDGEFTGIINATGGKIGNMSIEEVEQVTEDMAQFRLTANNIQMAVDNSKLIFDAEYGLTVQNGGMRIISADGTTTLMEYDPNSNALKITGSGNFTGEIYATDGEFTGTIHATNGDFNGKITATEGDIGGFIIQNDGLYSRGGAETESGYDINSSNIKILGKDGRIEAENITLGVGAKIDKYIELGKAKLWNPDHKEASGKLLEAGGVKLSQTGELTLDGDNSKISGRLFSITPELATFQNINVSGKISTAVFEQNHVQSVGGSMIFKPSYKVEGCKTINNKTVLTLDRKFLGKIDKDKVRNYVYLVKTDGTLIPEQISISEKNDEYKTVTLSSNLNLSSEDGTNPLISLIDIGIEGSLIIGINSNDGETGFLRPRGFTIAEFTTGESRNPKVFLGDLEESGITLTGSQGLKGFGLYSENVYLTGSLTTQINNNSSSTYAGINTLNGATASKFNPELGVAADNSKIVFWAGATNMTNINNAPFQVTETGSLYASQGLFEGAIISKSRIQGVDIYAARIHGWNIEENTSNSLTFYDASKGIVFKKGDYSGIGEDESTEIFSIGNDGLKTKNNYFINIANSKIKFIGDEIQTSDYFTNKAGTSFLHLHLKDNQILGSHIEENGSEKIYTNISFNEEELSFGLDIQKDFVINSNEIQLKKDTVKINKTVLFGERLKYEQTTDGYNLYVL